MAIQIKLGSTGNAVKALQAKLNGLMHGEEPLIVDGVFGPKMEAAVKLFQATNGLKADGIIGPITFDKIAPPKPFVPPKRNKVEPLRQQDKVERALMCVGGPIEYHLEVPNGGTDPEAAMPCDEATGQCDCSGFNAWVQGFDRQFMLGMSDTLGGWNPATKKYEKWGGWANTDSKIAAAQAGDPLFSVIPLEEAQPGDMIVGETWRNKGTGKKVIGHEGTIVAVHDLHALGLAGLSVVHCSPANVKKNKQGSAVWKTDGTIWSNYATKSTLLIIRFNADVAYRKYLDLLAVREGHAVLVDSTAVAPVGVPGEVLGETPEA